MLAQEVWQAEYHQGARAIGIGGDGVNQERHWESAEVLLNLQMSFATLQMTSTFNHTEYTINES